MAAHLFWVLLAFWSNADGYLLPMTTSKLSWKGFCFFSTTDFLSGTASGSSISKHVIRASLHAFNLEQNNYTEAFLFSNCTTVIWNNTTTALCFLRVFSLLNCLHHGNPLEKIKRGQRRSQRHHWDSKSLRHKSRTIRQFSFPLSIPLCLMRDRLQHQDILQ